MMWTILYMIPLLLLIVCVGIMVVEICKIFFGKSRSIEDEVIRYLDDDVDEIRRITKKYNYKVRGSVRMGQGRIKSLQDAYEMEKDIRFP